MANQGPWQPGQYDPGAHQQRLGQPPQQPYPPPRKPWIARHKALTVLIAFSCLIVITPKFTVTATWKLAYSFDCSNFGASGNFQVFEDGGFNVLANDLATSKSASTMQYSDAGSHYLEINSECSWTVRVIDEGS